LKKIGLVLSSIFVGLLIVLYFNPFVKGVIASLITGKESHYYLKGILLNVDMGFSESTTIFTYAFLLIIPLLVSLVFIEVTSVILKKNNNINFRLGLVIFQLVNIGYLVVNIFIAIIAVAFRGLLINGWVKLLDYANFKYTKQILLMLVILILLFVYINFCANRLKKYMTIVKE